MLIEERLNKRVKGHNGYDPEGIGRPQVPFLLLPLLFWSLVTFYTIQNWVIQSSYLQGTQIDQ